MQRWAYKFMRDEALLAAYGRGKSLAFEVLYQRHKDAVFAFVYRQCSHQQVAEDLVHDAWLAVISQAKSFTPQAAFKTWLYRIAHNRLVDHWRKQGRNAKVLFEELKDVHASRSNSVSESRELLDLLASLEALSCAQSEALLLKIEGFSYAEIADITDSKPETVKSRLRYAGQHLRLQLEAAQ